MKKPHPSYIQVNIDLSEILDKVAVVLYEMVQVQPVNSQSEFHRLVYESLNQVMFPAEVDTAKLVYLEPKLQMAKSGPVGDSSYAASIERQDYARRKPRKPYRTTPARQMQQTRMQQAINAWNSTDYSIQTQWEDAALNMQMAGVHLFRGIYIARLVDNLSIPEPFIPTPELLQYYQSR